MSLVLGKYMKNQLTGLVKCVCIGFYMISYVNPIYSVAYLPASMDLENTHCIFKRYPVGLKIHVVFSNG
jgi:hypothetical protein